MTTKQGLDLARWAVGEARKQGANEVGANARSSRNVDVEVRAGKVEKLQEAVESGLSLTLFIDHKYSSHSTNDLRRDSLERFIAEAVAMTRYLSADEFRALPDPKYYAGQEKRELKRVDPSFARTETPERIKRAKEIDAAGLAAGGEKVISVQAYYSDGYGFNVKVHSNGFEGQSDSTSFSAHAQATVNDGKGGRPEDYSDAFARHLKTLPDPAAIGKDAAQRALRKIGQHKVASGKFDLIVENRAASRVFSPLIGAMNGRSLQQKNSFLEGMLGKTIGSEKLTVREDPFIPEAPGSRLFDSDGIAARPRTVFEKGVLRTWYIDNYYGRKLGMEPTSGGPTNLLFEPGDKDLAALTKGLSKGIVVTDFIGGNSNGTTGDFSFGIMGLYVENGAVQHPINEMNISGNMKELWKQLAEFGSDPYPYGSWRIPSVHFKEVQFSGV